MSDAVPCLRAFCGHAEGDHGANGCERMFCRCEGYMNATTRNLSSAAGQRIDYLGSLTGKTRPCGEHPDGTCREVESLWPGRGGDQERAWDCSDELRYDHVHGEWRYRT